MGKIVNIEDEKRLRLIKQVATDEMTATQLLGKLGITPCGGDTPYGYTIEQLRHIRPGGAERKHYIASPTNEGEYLRILNQHGKTLTIVSTWFDTFLVFVYI